MRVHQTGANKFTHLSDVPASYIGEANQHLAVNALETGIDFVPGGGGGGSGTVTDVSVVTANGVSGSVANSTTTPAITLTLGAITPSSVASVGSVTGSNLSGTNTGNVTLTGTPDYITITDQVITRGLIDLTTDVTGDLPFANISQIGTSSILGRVTASTGDIEILTGTQVTTLLDVFTTTLKGLVPASGGGTSNFLRADGTWATPAGGVSDGDKGDITVTASGSTWTIDNGVVTAAKTSITGTPDGSKYLRDDFSWQPVSGGSGLTSPQVLARSSLCV